jgi:electron transfer flavoprotein beta subunit
MRIAVCIKMVTGAAVDAEDMILRAGRTLPAVLPTFDAHAVEAALRIRQERALNDEIVLLSIGAREGLGALRQALAMGADRAVLLSDPQLADADIVGISHILAALLQREAPDLVLSCPWSGDLDGSMLLAMTAARLKMASIGPLRSLAIEVLRVAGERQTEAGDEHVAADLPCLVEIADTINKPRSPTIKDRQKANAKPVELLTLRDLFDRETVALQETVMLDSAPAPSTRHPVLLQQHEAAEGVIALLRDRSLLP